MNGLESLLSLERAAQMLGDVSVKTVRRLVAAGEIGPFVKIGRLSKLLASDVQRYLESLKAQRDGRGNA